MYSPRVVVTRVLASMAPVVIYRIIHRNGPLSNPTPAVRPSHWEPVFRNWCITGLEITVRASPGGRAASLKALSPAEC